MVAWFLSLRGRLGWSDFQSFVVCCCLLLFVGGGGGGWWVVVVGRVKL